MKNIFELNYCEFAPWEDMEAIQFYGDRGLSVKDFTDFIETSKELNTKFKTIDSAILMKHCEDEFIDFIEDLYEWNKDDDQTLKEFTTEFLKSGHEDFKYELEDFIFSELENNVISEILSEIGITFDSVGYSSWSYYLALDIYDVDFIEDMFNGYNWYDISQYDENGVLIDSIVCIYAPETSDLINAIEDHFLNEDDLIYLVDNDFSTYFEDEKIKKVQTYYEKRFAL